MGKIAIALLAALLTVTTGAAAWTVAALPTTPPPAREPIDPGALAALETEIDDLEERLLAAKAKIGLWDELRTRHQDVAQVACANLGEHAAALVQREQRMQAQLADQKKRRVATVSVTAQGGPP